MLTEFVCKKYKSSELYFTDKERIVGIINWMQCAIFSFSLIIIYISLHTFHMFPYAHDIIDSYWGGNFIRFLNVFRYPTLQPNKLKINVICTFTNNSIFKWRFGVPLFCNYFQTLYGVYIHKYVGFSLQSRPAYRIYWQLLRCQSTLWCLTQTFSDIIHFLLLQMS